MTKKTVQTCQLDVLNDWFAKPIWEVREAACILTGVLPPQRTGDSSEFGGWLPGRKPWDVGRDPWLQFIRAEIANIQAVLREDKRVKDHTPESYLVLAVRLRILPPWADAFLSSPDHSSAVSARTRSKLRELLGKTGEHNPGANRSYAARAENWAEAVFRAVELREDGRTAREIADILPSEGYLRDRKETKPYGVETIRGWFRSIDQVSAEGVAHQKALKFTDGFRRWRDQQNPELHVKR